MNKNRYVGSAVFAAALLVSGCVTKSTYEKLEAEKNQEIAQLQADRQALQQQSAELQEQIQALESQSQTLEHNKAWLEQEQIAMQSRIGLLAQEREALQRQQAELKESFERQRVELQESLERQRAELAEMQREFGAQRAALQQQIEELEQQKMQLLASSQETQVQYDELVRNLTEEVQKGQLQVRQYKNMLTVDVAEQLFFDSGEASLKSSGKEVLKKVGDVLRGYDDKVIRVVGHTDNVPIARAHQKVFPSNWELSVARATTVVRYLQEVGIPPDRMVASGRGEHAPVASNDSAEGRRKNRRIEIMLIDRNLIQEMARAPE